MIAAKNIRHFKVKDVPIINELNDFLSWFCEHEFIDEIPILEQISLDWELIFEISKELLTQGIELHNSGCSEEEYFNNQNSILVDMLDSGKVRECEIVNYISLIGVNATNTIIRNSKVYDWAINAEKWLKLQKAGVPMTTAIAIHLKNIAMIHQKPKDEKGSVNDKNKHSEREHISNIKENGLNCKEIYPGYSENKKNKKQPPPNQRVVIKPEDLETEPKSINIELTKETSKLRQEVSRMKRLGILISSLVPFLWCWSMCGFMKQSQLYTEVHYTNGQAVLRDSNNYVWLILILWLIAFLGFFIYPLVTLINRKPYIKGINYFFVDSWES